ncbi:MAG: EAL domain-containing protein, partial [Candidatus Omnitrophota bacterium]
FKNCVTASKDLPPAIKRHLNIFPSTMIDIPVRNLLQVFEESTLNGSYCIEISEQQIIGDPSYLVEAVTQLKKSGVEIAIDDVGFGRSCLESLILLEPDVVKIDKKLVNGISKNEWCEHSLKRFLKVTEALGSEVIAEGIETLEDMETLVSLGVKYGQGYYLGRPA